MDEAWHQDENCIVIWGPQLIMKTVSIYCFSSGRKNYDHHWFGKIVLDPKYYDDVKVINYPKICTVCKKKNPEKSECEHIKIRGSTLKDESMSAVRSVIGNETADIENLGLIGHSFLSAFKKEQIHRLFSKERVKYNKDEVEFFLMSVDSNYGGDNDYALSICYTNKKNDVIFVWGSYYDCKNKEEVHDLVSNNIIEFRNVFGIDKKLVIVYESQARWCGSDMESWMREKSKNSLYFDEIYFITEGKRCRDERTKKNYGINIFEARLDNYVNHFESGLSRDCLYISSQFDCYQIEKKKLNPDYFLKESEEQICRFRHFVKKQNPGEILKNNSGKVGKKNDDISIVWLMCVYWCFECLYNYTYKSQIQ
jgi:hypothetical protein